MGQPFCAQNYALCFIIYLFIYLFIYAARCRNVQGLQQYGTLIPMPKFLKMSPSYDTRNSSSRFQMPLPKTNWQKRFGYRHALIWDELPRICAIPLITIPMITSHEEQDQSLFLWSLNDFWGLCSCIFYRSVWISTPRNTWTGKS